MKKTLIFIFCFLCYTTTYCQQKSNIRKNIYILFDTNSKYAASCNISEDKLSGGFSIYYKQYINKSKRDEALKKYYDKVQKDEEARKKNNNIPNINAAKKPVFAKWFTCTKPHLQIKKQDLPAYITLEEYANSKALNFDSIKIIYKINDEDYLIWTGSHLRER